eukprot:CAMPEP_0115332540 /NCGR_PEP_ID=MMETSP0270-20121206/86891_1 /TAXON_ID=71861 /ORGANISM="Scrippsiella trochoidea, Strain CCMP3099" /LENGTH=65 /DNA_ID=CAMNT_0002753381 /DNA_START=109 /DNA_END=306 /DNA_ORIENTATION=-
MRVAGKGMPGSSSESRLRNSVADMESMPLSIRAWSELLTLSPMISSATLRTRASASILWAGAVIA